MRHSSRPDYRNWVPRSMVFGLLAGTIAAFLLFLALGVFSLAGEGTVRTVCALVFGIGTLVLLFMTVWMTVLYRAFDYNGKRRLSKAIIDGIAKHVTLPEGGTGLDVGCGSGALTIACARRNPKARMVGCDIWSGSYKAVFSRQLCEEKDRNACFTEGNAIQLPFPDASFDAVTSNYVYHNIPGRDRQKLLLETLRVLRKGGTFAIHDLMSRPRYGDMDAFVRELKAQGYEDVRLIDTTDGASGFFRSQQEAQRLGLGGSTLLVGRK